MNRIFIGFVICFFLLNCNKKKENISKKNIPYIISHEDKKLQNYIDSLKESNNKTAAYPRKGFYGEHQLIIDKKGNLYYYQKEYFISGCGTRSKNDTIPHFIDLKPKDIVGVPEKNLTDFLSENILKKENYRQILVIASQKDTITNTSFFDFLNIKNISNYIIRRTTQEEDTVLKYKTDNKYYFSGDIKWDQNRITLPFIKPKLEKTKD